MTESVIAVESALQGSEVIRRLTRQLELFHQLGQLSLEQGEIVNSGDPGPLLSLLARRNQIIDEVGRLNAELVPFKVQWSQLAATLGPDEREQINSLAAEIEALRNTIIYQDDQDRERLEVARNQIGEQLATLSQVGRARNAYGLIPAEASSQYTDRQA